MSIVVDASVFLALCFEDEQNNESERILDMISRVGGLAPPLLWYELRNALLVGERRGRISAARIEQFLDLVEKLPIRYDSAFSDPRTLTLARHYALSIYDASYLALASRARCALATFDQVLARAAADLGVLLGD